MACEREYIALLFEASSKYANWDPDVSVKVGDYGRLTCGKRGWFFWRPSFWRPQRIFVKEGNIYDDGKAEEFDIPPPKERGGDGTGVNLIVSSGARKTELGVDANLYVLSFFKFPG